MDLDSNGYSKLTLTSYGNVNFENYGRIIDAIWPLSKRRDHEIPEMWCFHICGPFRKILEENPGILSKNGYILMCRKLYKSNKVHAYLTNYIYCNICNSLVFIPDTSFGIHIYQNNHLKRCISENSILNKHARRKEILKSINRRKFKI